MPVTIIRKPKADMPAAAPAQPIIPATPVPEAVQKVIGATFIHYQVLEALKAHPEGLTNRQLCEATGLEWNTLTPRMRPLANKGEVVEAGTRKYGTWPTAIVWKLVPKK